jgi:4-amino-4-deoxy-L-arabinose transferase-like glycosyltransferase
MALELIPNSSKKITYWTLLLGLLLIAAVPRLYQLGHLGFYGDEETTALPAYKLATQQEISMPSGMPYLRALPQTWLNAASANQFGLDKELSYRIPSAIFGIITIPLLFLMARPLVGTPVAFLASLMLALSEWHIATSREARMYAPFLVFYLVTGFSILYWAITFKARYLVLATASLIATVSLHTFSVFVVLFAIIPLLLNKYNWKRSLSLISFFLVGTAFARWYGSNFVAGEYGRWKALMGKRVVFANAPQQHIETLPSYLLNNLYSSMTLILLLLCAIPLYYVVKQLMEKHRENPNLVKLAAQFSLIFLIVFSASMGLIHAFLIFTFLFLLLSPAVINLYSPRTYIPLLAFLLICLLRLVGVYLSDGLSGIKELLLIPYPYLSYFVINFPGVAVLFFAVCVLLIFNKKITLSDNIIAILLASLFPVIVIGVVSKWEGMRYLIEAYPLFLIVGAAGLWLLINKILGKWRFFDKRKSFAISSLIIFSGILGGHGISQAINASTVAHGDRINPYVYGFNFYPDHRSAGKFVNKNLRDNDIVIAEDVLQQYWYIGRVDYWLKDPISHQGYLYLDKTKTLRDIYVGSQIITNEALQKIRNNHTQRIWIVTSAEIVNKSQNLNQRQIEWLNSVTKSYGAFFTAKDGITKVYCVNCGNGQL